MTSESQSHLPLFAIELAEAKKTVRGTSILELYRAFSIGNLVAITGSGTTTLLNYPAWRDIISSFMQKAILELKDRPGTGKTKYLENLQNSLNKVANDGLAMAALSMAQSKLARSEFGPGGLTGSEMRKIVAALYQSQRLWTHPVPRIYPLDYFPSAGDPPPDLVMIDKSDSPIWVKHRDAGNKSKKLGAPRPTIDLPMELIRNWGVRRLATYNYDLELEAALEDLDFPLNSLTQYSTPDGPRNHKTRSRIGVIGQTLDITISNAADLIAFAVNYPTGAMQIIHLHGSAASPESLVLTDSDYNYRYTGPSEERAILEDAQELLFTGNAIIFIGLGMSEDDVMRPLRRLASSPMRRNRPIFAFLPSLKGQANDECTAIVNEERYGVQTVFFGTKLALKEEAMFGSWSEHPLVRRMSSSFDRRGARSRKPVPPDALSDMKDELAFLNCADDVLSNFEDDTFDARKFEYQLGCWNFKLEAFVDEHDRMMKLPRLSSTPFFSDLFEYFLAEMGTIVKSIGGFSVSKETKQNASTLRCVISKLRNAIVARSLLDTLEFVRQRARDWRRSWSATLADNMWRGADSGGAPPAALYRHLTVPHPSLTEEICSTLQATFSFSSTNLVYCLPKGAGVGTLAAGISVAFGAAQPQLIRHFYSFANSCESESVFASIEAILAFVETHPDARAQLVMLKTDYLFDKHNGCPGSFEWTYLLRRISSHPRIQVIVLCNVDFIKRYFVGIGYDADRNIDDLKRFLDSFRSKQAAALDRSGASAAVQKAISTGSMMSLMLVSKFHEACETETEETRTEAWAAFCNFIEHHMDAKYPGRPDLSVIEATLEQHENLVLARTSRSDALAKVYSHLILRHLFAIALPVSEEPLFNCPEFSQIYEQLDGVDHTKAKKQAMETLKSLSLVLTFRSRSGAQNQEPQYGLHSSVRNYLAKVKGLPFSYISNREQAASSLACALSEEIVELSSEDMKFIHNTVRHLAAENLADRQGGANLRAAFGMLRGSLRIAVAMRGASDVGQNEVSSLEEYFKSLLSIRAKLLRDNMGSRGLYRHEWMWLFNELGVIRLVQGNMHDAVPLLEQALQFDESYQGELPSVTVRRARYLLNLACALLDRGSISGVEEKLHLCRNILEAMAGKADREIEKDNRGMTFADHPERKLLLSVSYVIEAQVCMLRARSSSAKKALQKALKLGILSFPNRGLASWFYRTKADVWLLTKSVANAKICSDRCLSEAVASGRPDMVFGARLLSLSLDARGDGSRAHDTEQARVLAELESIEAAAERVGLLRYCCTARMLRASQLLDSGVVPLARDLLISALAMASVNGLKTKRIKCLNELARAYSLMGGSDLFRKEAQQLRATALAETKRMGYLAAIAGGEDAFTPNRVERSSGTRGPSSV
jgi:hypothetical protein